MSFIPLSVPNLKGNERKYVNQAIDSEWVSTGGSFISQFEASISSYLGTENAVACQSGTAALHLALIGAGVSSSDIVIVPTLTFVAAVNPVKYISAEPVFMDCDDTLCLDMDKLEQFLEDECQIIDQHTIHKSSGKKIAAIIVVHVFGNACNLEKLMNLKSKYGFKVIEDATEALGSYYIDGPYKGRYLGTIGDIGVYSFNGNKIITTGGGGMLVSSDQDILSLTKHLSTQAKTDVVHFDHDQIGYNYRMTNIQAAMGVAQMEQLESFIATKKDNYFRYLKNDIKLHPFIDSIRPNYWFYSYITDQRNEVMAYLNDQNIQSRPIWKLIHTLAPYKDARTYRIENAPIFMNRIVNIPCSSNLSSDDVDTVSNAIKQFEKR